MWYRILRTKEYCEWFEDESPKSQAQTEKRIAKIEIDGHFGDHKRVAECVWELRDGQMVVEYTMPILKKAMCFFC